MLLEFNATALTAHEAAPVELAAAPLDDDPPTSLEASTTAHQLAAVSAGRLTATQTTARAQRTRPNTVTQCFVNQSFGQ